MPVQPFIGEIALFSFDFAPSGWAQCNGQFLPVSQNSILFGLIGTTFGGNGVTTFGVPDLRGRIPLGFGQGPGVSNYTLGQSGGAETATLTLGQLPYHQHSVTNNLTATARGKHAAANRQTPAASAQAISSILPYTDPTLTPAMSVIKAVHFTELRSRVNAFRAYVGLPAFSYTTPVLTIGSTAVMGQHLLDLRTALSQGYAQAMLPAPIFAEPIVVGTTVVKASHLTEIRNAVNAVTNVGTSYSRGADANMHPNAIALSGAITAAYTGGGQPHNNRQPTLALRYCIALQGVTPAPAEP